MLWKAVAEFFVGLIARLVSDWRRDRASEAKGRAEERAETSDILAGMADEQKEINAAPRGNARDVLERLRSRS